MAGVSGETLSNLVREHTEELALMREQHRLLTHEIHRQKQREEVAALLSPTPVPPPPSPRR